MNIGEVRLRSRFVLAPLSGFTDAPFRHLAMIFGAGLVVSEMVNARGLVEGNKRSLSMIKAWPGDAPFSVQIFGSDPSYMAGAAAAVQESGADIVDINMGCPMKKVVKTGAGAALMRQPQLARRIIREVRRTVSMPLTVKMRSGWDNRDINALDIAKMAQDEGADCVIIHPRTREQLFSGRADWSVIRLLASSLSIPVIGNGDVIQPEDALKMMEETSCDGVMIGRAALGRPWIFRQVATLASGRFPLPRPSAEALLRIILLHIRLCVNFWGKDRAFSRIRPHIFKYTKGLPGSSEFRHKMNSITKLEDLIYHLSEYFSAARGVRTR